MAIFEKGFADKVNYRVADKCCAPCGWMEWCRNCCGPCTNPKTFAKNHPIVDDCGLCDLWEPKISEEED